jgi:hypothetical protein
VSGHQSFEREEGTKVKPIMKKSELRDRDSIWNAVVHTVCYSDFPTENTTLQEAFVVFQYYSELESGGHESLFTWFSDYITEVGISNYLKELVAILEKIGAHDFARMEEKYGEEMWRLFVALEKGEMEEETFYHLIEKADNEYWKLNHKLGELLENYFVTIHTEIIEVQED